ncbi:MAG: hypothetical protein H6625_11915 [Bdellovibrionaceae bacterium]|nr:hypothetical protein [Pseudobdellovibrionaceae bacterium]
MYSRKLFIFIFIGFIWLTTGCSLEIGETSRGPVQVANKDMVCVRDLGKGVDKYLEASLTKKEIYNWAACVNDAIYNFDKYTQGEKADRYSVAEVTKTVGEVVFPDKPITQKLVATAMVVKKYLVGGDSEYVTRNELRRLQDLVWTVEDSAVLLNPHIPILNLKVVERPKPETVEIAGQRLFDAIALILNETESYRVNVEFTSINDFIVELQKFNESSPESAQAFTELARHFYNTITGEPYDNQVIQDKNSVLFFKELSYWYRLRMHYVYQVRDKKLLEGEGLAETKYFVDQILTGIKRVINRYEKEAYISYNQIDALVDGFYNAHLLPKPYRGESVKAALRPFFDKMFGDRSIEFDKRASLGIDQQVIAEIEAEFYKWYEVQNFLAHSFELNNKSFSQMRFIDHKLWPEFLSSIPQTESHYIEIKSIWEKTKLRFQWGDPRLVVGTETYIEEVNAGTNFYQLSLLNILSSAVRIVAKSYPQDLYRAQVVTGITEKEMDRFINDFKLIWQDLNIMPPEAIEVGKKMFIETNLFAPSGNGYFSPSAENPTAHLMDFNEGVELLSMLYSGYTMNSKIFEKYKDTCLRGPKDVFGKPMFVSTCFWQNFKKFYASEFETMPGIKKFLQELEPNSQSSKKQEDWETFVSAMDKLVRYDWEPERWLGTIQMGKATMILHFVETMINKFDLNHDGFIDEIEGLRAYSHFRGILDRMARERCKVLDEEQLQTVYIFILKYAKVPGGKWDAIWNKIWTSKADKVDHLQVLKIFRQILVANSPEYNVDVEKCVYNPTEDDVFGQMLKEAGAAKSGGMKKEINRLKEFNK